MKNIFDSLKFLGIRLDDNLTWSSHTEDVSSRLSRVIFLLRNLKNFITPVYARSAYFSFFQSVFRYGLISWGNSGRIREILILQKKHKPLFIKLEVLTVINLFIYDVLLYTLNNMNNYNLVSTIHNHNTRNNKNIQVPYTRLSRTVNSHMITGVKI
ncbi:hypothetical protein C0J52_03183 [Blattella germanica]|nr:hypothetical protein C0J52_03183 [Blattella germanica]